MNVLNGKIDQNRKVKSSKWFVCHKNKYMKTQQM